MPGEQKGNNVRARVRLAPGVLLLGILAAAGISLTVGVIPGIFSVDDGNYLVNVIALRQGRVTVPQTDGLLPSAELLSFDPGPWSRAVHATPVASTAPPLYALLAFPLSPFGWRGLVLLNTLAFLSTIFLVFEFVRKRTDNAVAAWLAAVTFGVGSFGLEYAQGLWPHSLSVALCTGGILAAVRALDRGQASAAAISGLLIGVAAGVRYQNAIALAAIGLSLVLWSRRRAVVLAAFVGAALVPLTTSSFINHARHDSWHPLSKGRGYISVPVIADAGRSWQEPLTMLWARVADYSARPKLTSRAFEGWIAYDPATGAHVMPGGVPKKALLQSAPWAVIGLASLVLVWLRPRRSEDAASRPLRLFSVVVAAILLAFALSGSGRDDGWSYNQRYLLELMPIVTIATILAVDPSRWRRGDVAALAISASAAAIVLLVAPPVPSIWVSASMRLPLVLAAALLVLWLRWRPSGRNVAALAIALGICVGWAAGLHVAQDVRASRAVRRSNENRTQLLARLLPERSMLVAYWGAKDAALPLMWDRGLVILDTRADEGRDAPRLIRQAFDDGRPVFLLDDDMPADVKAVVVDGLEMGPRRNPAVGIHELQKGGS